MFNDLSPVEKSDFLKYEIAVIELDLENNDPKVQEIFQRINRTSNSLTTIEKMASEYSTSEYMLVAKLLANAIDLETSDNQDDFREDPNIPKEFFVWAKTKKVNKFQSLITLKGIFSSRDIARKVHLMHVLNIMSTISTDFFNRNERSISLLNDYSLIFDEKDEIINLLESSADSILKLKLKQKSMWYSKSNSFSLIIAFANYLKENTIDDNDIESLKLKLERFENNVPEDYKLAATEGVNNKRERELRNTYIVELLNQP